MTGDPVVGFSALEWSVPAMRGATRRLTSLGRSDRTSAIAAVSDAVWAVTIVDAAMLRYHPDVYERVLAAESSADRQLIEQSMAGLRFVRNQIRDDTALAEFVGPDSAEDAAGHAGARTWIWKSVTRPPLARHRPRARAWETARYRAYQARLAGHPVPEVFERAEAFLVRTSAAATAVTDIGV